MNHTANFRVGTVNFAVDGKLVVPFAFARQRIAFEVDQHQIVLRDFLKTDPGAFDPVLSGSVRQRRDVTIDHIVVSLHGEDSTGEGELLLQIHSISSRLGKNMVRIEAEYRRGGRSVKCRLRLN
jgi:transcriptional regulator of acetoin/glycerol metabolism